MRGRESACSGLTIVAMHLTVFVAMISRSLVVMIIFRGHVADRTDKAPVLFGDLIPPCPRAKPMLEAARFGEVFILRHPGTLIPNKLVRRAEH